MAEALKVEDESIGDVEKLADILVRLIASERSFWQLREGLELVNNHSTRGIVGAAPADMSCSVCWNRLIFDYDIAVDFVAQFLWQRLQGQGMFDWSSRHGGDRWTGVRFLHAEDHVGVFGVNDFVLFERGWIAVISGTKRKLKRPWIVYQQANNLPSRVLPPERSFPFESSE